MKKGKLSCVAPSPNKSVESVEANFATSPMFATKRDKFDSGRLVSD